MNFSIENLRELLDQSKGLNLLPDSKKKAFVSGVLTGNEALQKKVFSILLKAKDQVVDAEKNYNKRVSKALDEYMVDVQGLQKKTLMDLRKQVEQKQQLKDTEKVDTLLNTLNNL